jgi:hypothetical protein
MSDTEVTAIERHAAALARDLAYWKNLLTTRTNTLRARAEKAERERDTLRQENARLSIKLTVSEQDVEHWSGSNAAARAQLRSLLDFAERHQLSHADHDHDCYELWCIERDYTRRLIEAES